MSRIVTVILAALFGAAPAFGQTFVEVQAHAVGYQLKNYMDVQYVHPGSKADLYVFSLVSEGFGEVLAGASKQVTGWLNVGMAGGFETGRAGWRVSPKAYAANKDFYVFAVGEWGASGTWYQVRAAYKASPKLDVGFHSQRFYGTGPYARWYGDGNFSLWASMDVVQRGRFAVGVIRTFD